MGDPRGGHLVIGRVLYGLLFAGAIPVGLWYWARVLEPSFPLSPVSWPVAGAAVAVAGFALMVAGMVAIVTRGGGLPMNAFPPTRLVRTGALRWFDNPIYVGFGFLVVGCSLATGSAAGLWLVTPVTALSMTALVLGYERHDLRRRFGSAALAPSLLVLPRADDGRPDWNDRAGVFLRVLAPWFVTWFAVQALGRAPDTFVTTLPFERAWPVVSWTEGFYATAYLFVPLAPLLVVTRRDLRAFAIRGLVATIIVSLCWLVIPVVADNRPFVPDGPMGRLLAFEQRNSQGVAAFPAFHVLWTLIAAQAWAANAAATGHRGWHWIGVAWATAITVSTLTTAMHSVIEVAAALLLFLPIRRLDRTWNVIRDATERLANSWHEWHVGPVRIMSHGAYVAFAALVGLLVAGTALGDGRSAVVTWVGFCMLIGAGLLAQWLEGSPTLLRPFGWYGGMLGAVIGGVTLTLAGVPMVPVLASFAIASPWIQILGRLRCLVQGCCHGGPASDAVGIRYRHRRSRVTQLSDLAGRPIHATPLYSIAANLVIGVLLVRLRVLGAPDPLVLGGYLMASGITRFVEESYRAEPQTRVVGGLRIYQWMAIGSLLAGVLSTLLPVEARAPGFVVPSAALLGSALGMALLAWFMMGVDFPASSRRFARLAPVDGDSAS
jgi:protein-S-isoprenylcysteine O-methyltransferase Ste14